MIDYVAIYEDRKNEKNKVKLQKIPEFPKSGIRYSSEEWIKLRKNILKKDEKDDGKRKKNGANNKSRN